MSEFWTAQIEFYYTSTFRYGICTCTLSWLHWRSTFLNSLINSFIVGCVIHGNLDWNICRISNYMFMARLVACKFKERFYCMMKQFYSFVENIYWQFQESKISNKFISLGLVFMWVRNNGWLKFQHTFRKIYLVFSNNF